MRIVDHGIHEMDPPLCTHASKKSTRHASACGGLLPSHEQAQHLTMDYQALLP
jgi:hypothetical protein